MRWSPIVVLILALHAPAHADPQNSSADFSLPDGRPYQVDLALTMRFGDNESVINGDLDVLGIAWLGPAGGKGDRPQFFIGGGVLLSTGAFLAYDDPPDELDNPTRWLVGGMFRVGYGYSHANLALSIAPVWVQRSHGNDDKIVVSHYQDLPENGGTFALETSLVFSAPLWGGLWNLIVPSGIAFELEIFPSQPEYTRSGFSFRWSL